MKIRTDFVTNSSSSSFIVTINKENELNDIEKEKVNELSNQYYDWLINDENDLSNLIKNIKYLDDDMDILLDESSRKLFLEYSKYLDDKYDFYYFDNIDDCSNTYDFLCELDNLYSKNIFVKEYY